MGLLHSMRVIALAHACPRATGLMRVKNSTHHFYLWHFLLVWFYEKISNRHNWKLIDILDSLRQVASNYFYFIWHALFVLEIFNFFNLFPSFPISILKRTNESRIIYDAMNWLAYISRCNFWNNSKVTLYYIIKLGQAIHH